MTDKASYLATSLCIFRLPFFVLLLCQIQEVQLGFNVNDKAKLEGLHGPIMFRGKAVNLPINIQSGGEKNYNVFVPVGLINQEYIDMEKVEIHLIGYKTKVEGLNRFEMFGPYRYE